MTAEDIGLRFTVLVGLPFILAIGVIAGIIWAVLRVTRPP